MKYFYVYEMWKNSVKQGFSKKVDWNWDRWFYFHLKIHIYDMEKHI